MSNPEDTAPGQKILQENLYSGENPAGGPEEAPQPGKQPPDANKNREPSGNETEPEAQADPTDKG
jgi:hypothetical protein